MIKMKLREEILKLLEEDKELRLMIAGLLGYRDLLVRLEAHDRKFNEILERLDRHTRLLEEHSKRLEAHDRKFNELIEQMNRLRADFVRLSRKIDVTLGSMGRRWGIDLEKTVLEIFRETLERKGIEPGKVEKFRFKDIDGRVTGMKGKIVDVDILVKDDKVYVIEVKSRAEIEHVDALPEKVRIVEKILGKHVTKVYLVAVNIDRDAYERARELMIETIYGNIIE